MRPEAVLQGINVGDQIQGIREVKDLANMAEGHWVSMERDGLDARTRIGVLLLRIRSCVDTLEVMNGRLIHDRDGVILEGVCDERE